MGKLMFETTLNKYPALIKYMDGISATHFDSASLLREPGKFGDDDEDEEDDPCHHCKL